MASESGRKMYDPMISGLDPQSNVKYLGLKPAADSFARSKEKNPSTAGSLQDLFGLGPLFEDISTPTLTAEDMMLWKLPTPPQSPARDELPDCEESIDLTQFGKLDVPLECIANGKKPVPDFDLMDTDISELIDYMSSSTEIEEFSPDDELHSLSQSLHKGYYYKEEECVMMRGDIMWSESSRDPSPVRNKKRESTLSPVWDSALTVALQSDVLPPFPALSKSKSTEELSYRERSLALGTDTPSDSEEEIDVVNTEESERRPSFTQMSAEEIRVRVTAKRAAAAVEPQVQIEVNPRSQCFCPSSGSPSSAPPQHHHHIPVDHHNYSLPPSPARMPRTRTTCSRQSSPDSQASKRESVQRSSLSSQVVEQALQQAMQLQDSHRTQRGARKTTQKGQKRGKGGRGGKGGRVGKAQSANTAQQYIQVAAAAAASCVQNNAVPSGSGGGKGTKRKHDALNFEEDGDRRNQHNVLERNRRILLSGKFLFLKLLVPAIKDQDKASKVVILNNAERYVYELRSQEAQLLREHRSLKARNEALKKRLADLQKHR